MEREKSRSERRLAETEELLAKVKEESEENLTEARSKVAALERDVTRLRQSIAVSFIFYVHKIHFSYVIKPVLLNKMHL